MRSSTYGMIARAMGAISLSGFAVAQSGNADSRALVEHLLGLVGDEVVAVRPYSPSGIEVNRGYEMDTRPRRDYLGDCRSQRITFFRRAYPGQGVEGGPDALDRLVVDNRYQRPGWVRSSGPSECPDPGSGSWTVAEDDYTFDRAATALARLTEASAGTPYSFDFTCTEYGKPCAEPRERLNEALALGVGQVRYEGATLVASYGTYLGRQWIMRVETDAHRPGAWPVSVRLEFLIPAFS